MLYKIIHKTVYAYSGPVSLCHNIARLVPRDTARQHCRHARILIDPYPEVLTEYEDFFGNKVMYFAIQREHRDLRVTVLSEIEKMARSGTEINLYGHVAWEEVRRQLVSQSHTFTDAVQYIAETPMTTVIPEVAAYAQASFIPGRSFYEAAHDLMQRIYRDFKFQPGFTTISTPLSELMKGRRGVCQDFAHLAIACIRAMGLPARYMSGYLETLPPPGVEKLSGVDASHAWFAIFIPDMGWMEFDPTNNQVPGEQHIAIGWGRDYADIAPMKGVILSSGTHQLGVSVDVRRVHA
ncbi:MAG: transglutaminase family protein [Bacteroidetes bacterium]|nr:transglutaminase family protein [Bacteroidota bacterium]